MPLAYDNSSTPFYSEAERVFASAQDWTLNGADTLVVHFQGVPGAFTELASGKIILGAAGADIWNAADEFRFAYKPLNGNGSIVALVDSVANTNAWAKGGVMIRETLDAGSAFAAVYATPGNGCRYQAVWKPMQPRSVTASVATARADRADRTALGQDRACRQRLQRVLLDRRRELDVDVLESADDCDGVQRLRRPGPDQPQPASWPVPSSQTSRPPAM